MGPIRILFIPTVAAAVALAVLLGLGFWQLDRLAWKETLIKQVGVGVSGAPVPAPGPGAWETLGAGDDYRHVAVKGRFLDGVVFYYTALTKPAGPASGPGLMVYAPFQTEDGWVVPVNRGFVPQSVALDQRARAVRPPENMQTLTGLLRLGEKPNWTTPEPDPGDRIWFARDTGAMGAVLGISPDRAAPYSIDLDAAFTPSSGFPQAGETIIRFKNDHLGYALTWFGLAATLIGVYLTFAASVFRRRGKRADELPE